MISEQILEYYVPWCKESIENLLDSLNNDVNRNDKDMIDRKIGYIEVLTLFMVDYLFEIYCNKDKHWKNNLFSNYVHAENIVYDYYLNNVI